MGLVAEQRERGAEIGELEFAILLQHQVGGLDVALHQSLRLGVLQGVATLESDIEHRRHRQQGVRRGEGIQRAPLDGLENGVGRFRQLVHIDQPGNRS